MSEPTDKLDPMIQGYLLGAAIRIACIMQMQLLHTVVTRERERLTEALGHEPTEENWEDYWQLLSERAAKQKSCQREVEREKIRRLVMGDDSDASETR